MALTVLFKLSRLRKCRAESIISPRCSRAGD
jgi:hypothetical protein